MKARDLRVGMRVYTDGRPGIVLEISRWPLGLSCQVWVRYLDGGEDRWVSIRRVRP